MPEPQVVDDDHVRWITFDRPRSANALLVEDVGLATDAVRGIGQDIRAVVFTGSGGRAFSAGMHLDTFKDLDRDGARRTIAKIAELLRTVRRCPVPTVASLNGACVGAAFELALVCDVRIAHSRVRVGLPEVRVGIPSVVDAALLPSFIGLSAARELILTGDLYDLADLPGRPANRIVPAEELRAATLEMLARLISAGRQVLAVQKSLFETWLNSGIDESVATSIDVFADHVADPATAVHGPCGHRRS
jgi:enoyl-CoA hydratase